MMDRNVFKFLLKLTFIPFFPIITTNTLSGIYAKRKKKPFPGGFPFPPPRHSNHYLQHLQLHEFYFFKIISLETKISFFIHRWRKCCCVSRHGINNNPIAWLRQSSLGSGYIIMSCDNVLKDSFFLSSRSQAPQLQRLSKSYGQQIHCHPGFAVPFNKHRQSK